MALWSNNGQWDDDHCHYRRHFLCKTGNDDNDDDYNGNEDDNEHIDVRGRRRRGDNFQMEVGFS